MNCTITSQVIKCLILSLILGGLAACATPMKKASLQADKDWAAAIANAEKYQQLQRLMLQGLAASPPPAVISQPTQPLLTSEEHRWREIEQRERLYSDEWRVLEHDIAKRVLQRGL